MSKAFLIDEKLQNEWLKKNKPNSYFDTVDKKSIDKLIGEYVEVSVKGKKEKEKILKRRTCKQELKINGELTIINVNHYFTDNKVLTEDEAFEAKVNA